MNRDKDGTWSAEEIEEWLHEEWLRVQEMGDEAYIKVEEEEEQKWRKTLMKKKKEKDGKEKRKKQKKHISR